jgi:hypothetical protein
VFQKAARLTATAAWEIFLDSLKEEVKIHGLAGVRGYTLCVATRAVYDGQTAEACSAPTRGEE